MTSNWATESGVAQVDTVPLLPISLWFHPDAMEPARYSYLRQREDGKWEDTRFRFGRGERVRITKGRLKGSTGTIDGRLAWLSHGRSTIHVPGYHLFLDAGQWVTVRWDVVESMG